MDYICINKRTGIPLDIYKSNDFEIHKTNCYDLDGVFLKKNDYIDPTDGYFCQDKSIPPNRIYSKILCDSSTTHDYLVDSIKIASSNTNQEYVDASSSVLNKQIILTFTWFLIIELYLWYMLFLISYDGDRSFFQHFKSNLPIILLSVVGTASWLYFYCPFGLCRQDYPIWTNIIKSVQVIKPN